MPNNTEPLTENVDWKAIRCGHNYPPLECPEKECGFREALKEIKRLRTLLWKNVLCGGCGRQYTYNRADDAGGLKDYGHGFGKCCGIINSNQEQQ